MFLLLLFYLIIVIGIWYDKRFSLNRKFLFYFLFLSVNLVLWFLEKNPFYFFLYDLFWYPVVLYMSILWHVLILNWIYYYFWKKKFYYYCHIITIISWVTSLSLIIVILVHIDKKIYKYLSSPNYKVEIFFSVLKIMINIIIAILHYFVIQFHEFVYFLQGQYPLPIKKHIEIWKTYYKELLLFILKYILIFIFTLFISYFILGIPRLYFIWIFIFLNELKEFIYQRWVFFIKTSNKFQEPFQLKMGFYKLWLSFIYSPISKDSYKKLIEKYENIYFKMFNYNKLKFIYKLDGLIYTYETFGDLYLSHLGLETKDSLKDLFNYQHPYYIIREQYQLWNIIFQKNAGINWGWDLIFSNHLIDYLNLLDLEFNEYNIIDPEIPKGFNCLEDVLKYDKEYLKKHGRGKFPYNDGEGLFY